jgi:hypothetical protein
MINTRMKWRKKWRGEKKWLGTLHKFLNSGCISVSILTSYVKNLSNLEISTDEIKVSFKGEKVISSPGDQKFFDLAKDTGGSQEKYELENFFRNNRDAMPFVTKSNWNSPIFETFRWKLILNKINTSKEITNS